MTAKCKLSLLVLIMFIYRLFVNPIFFLTMVQFNPSLATASCQVAKKNAYLNKPAFLDLFTASQLGNGHKCDLQHQWRIFFLIECNKFHVCLNWRMRVSQNLDLMDFFANSFHLSFLLLFYVYFCCCPLYLHSSLWNCDWLTLYDNKGYNSLIFCQKFCVYK